MNQSKGKRTKAKWGVGALALMTVMLFALSGCTSSNQGALSSTSSQAQQSSAAESEVASSQTESHSVPQEQKTTNVFASTQIQARRQLDQLTLDEKIGQLFIARCPADDPIGKIEAYKPAGYILFASDLSGKNTSEVKEMINNYQAASGVRMIFGVDEEGGTVVRVSSNPLLADQKFKSPQDVFAIGGMPAIIQDTKDKSQLLLDLGIQLNLAPVADVSTNANDFIYDRTFGKDAETTANYISTVVTTMKDAGISSTLKHFPGYGNNVDTHTGIAIDQRPMSSFEETDFVPFEAGIKAGAPAILVSHNIVNCMDPNAPASLSKKVHNIIREKLGFTGIIMTDDLIMDAIPLYTEGADPHVMAFQAGNDILLTSQLDSGVEAIKTAVANGTITEQQINERVLRVLSWKLLYQ